MTIEINAQSISTKVWDWEGIKLMTTGSAVRQICSQIRYRLRYMARCLTDVA